MKRLLTTKYLVLALLILCVLLLCAANLFVGSVAIPMGEVCGILLGQEGAEESCRYIVLEARLPQMLTALLAGAALSVSGLMLQTLFRNPLAGPDVFGINAGAALAVAIVMLLFGGTIATTSFAMAGRMAMLVAAMAGATAVMALLLLFARFVRSHTLLLIVGIMVGYLASSLIALLNFFATAEGVKSYWVWGMGNFAGVGTAQLPLFACILLITLMASLFMAKPLNLLLLGTTYAANLGVRVARVRNLLLLLTGVLTAVVTAHCGPISFIGLAVPHLARLLFRTDDHRMLLPVSMLLGGGVALLCCLVCYLPGRGALLPLNAVTPLVGAPVVIYVILRKHGV